MGEFIINYPYIVCIIGYIIVTIPIIWLFGGMARYGTNLNIKTGEPND